jgi:copper chaperone CopZ
MTKKKETILDVQGMSCASCVRHVTAALSKLRGIEAVEVELDEGKVRVAHDPGGVEADEMIAALDGAGYEARES